MNNDEFFVHKLERHQTKDVSDSHVNGELTVVWRDWDDIVKDHRKMIYLNTVKPGEIKGPHIHKKRTTYFTCVEGEIVLVIKDRNDEYHEIKCNPNEPLLICVRSGVPAAIINTTNSISKVLVLADIAWRPNDNEMKNGDFTDYDFKKWE